MQQGQSFERQGMLVTELLEAQNKYPFEEAGYAGPGLTCSDRNRSATLYLDSA